MLSVRLMIFIVTGMLLIPLVYSSSFSEVCAMKWKSPPSCIYNEDKTKAACCWEEGDSQAETMDTYCKACEKNTQTGQWECGDAKKISAARFPLTDFLVEDGGTIKPPTIKPEISEGGPSVQEIQPPTNEERKTNIPKDLRGLDELSPTFEENKTKTPKDFTSKEKELLNNDNEISRQEPNNSSLQ